MASTSESTDRSGDETPHYYIVELKTAAGPRFAICERTVIVSPEENGIPLHLVEELLGRNPVRAAALTVGSGGAGTSLLGIAAAFQTGRSPLAAAFQTGRAPVVVDVTINNQTNGTPPKPPTVA